MSQTSLPSQTGPMARRIVRRSASVLAAERWITPAPRSKPSSSTYMVSMKATRMNHSVGMVCSTLVAGQRLGRLRRLGRGGGTMCRFAHHQEDVEQPQDEVHTREADQGEEDVPRGGA